MRGRGGDSCWGLEWGPRDSQTAFGLGREAAGSSPAGEREEAADHKGKTIKDSLGLRSATNWPQDLGQVALSVWDLVSTSVE